ELGARIQLAQTPYSLMLDSAAQARAARRQDEHPHLEMHPLAAQPEATAVLLFAESNSRFLCEVPQAKAAAFEKAVASVPHGLVGEVTGTGRLEIFGLPQPVRDLPDEPSELRVPLVINADVAELKEAWKKPLRW